MEKLIIWDFDGVVSDTEKLWLKTRQEMLDELYGIKMDFDTVNFYMGGRSDKTKRENLDKAGIITDDYFYEFYKNAAKILNFSHIHKRIKKKFSFYSHIIIRHMPPGIDFTMSSNSSITNSDDTMLYANCVSSTN